MELQGSDTNIGAAFPAFRVNLASNETHKLSVKLKGSAASSSGIYIRVYEYNALLPSGKVAISNSASYSLTQEDTSGKTNWRENQAVTTSWVTHEYTYTPTSGAQWASIVILNWDGHGTKSLYIRDPMWQLIGSSGAKGQKGAAGAKGQKGAAGAKGQKGEVGSKGQKGEVGQKGATGTFSNTSNISITKSLPKIVLDSSSSGDAWTAQGAQISLGESGDGGSAALHLTYRGDGYSYVGTGALTNGIPAYGYLRFQYNATTIVSNAHWNLADGYDLKTNGTTRISSGGLVRAANGSASAPSISLSGDTNTGLFRYGSDVLGITAGGTRRARFGSAIYLESSDVRINQYLYHNGDTNTYLQYDTDRIRLFAGGIKHFDTTFTRLDSYTSGTVPLESGRLVLESGGKTGWGSGDEFGSIDFYNSDGSGVGARNGARIVAENNQGNGSSTTTFEGELAFYTSPYNSQLNSDPALRLEHNNIARFYNDIRVPNGTAASPSYTFAADTDSGMFSLGSNAIAFSTGGTQRFKVNSNGLLLTGSSHLYVNGQRTITSGRSLENIVNITNTDGYIEMQRTGAAPAIFDRLGTTGASGTSRGELLNFKTAGSKIGRVAYYEPYGSNLVFAQGATSGHGIGLYQFSSTFQINPVNIDGTSKDNAVDLGASTARFDDVYATNGTIQTSDRNEKQDIQALTTAETAAATACKGLIRRYPLD